MSDSISMNLETGAQRVIHDDTGVAPPPASQPQQRLSIDPSLDGNACVTINGDGTTTVQIGGSARAESGDVQTYRERASTSIVSTAHSVDGMSVGKLTSETRVYLPTGHETTLGAAEAMGLIRQDGNGSYVDAQAPREAPSEHRQEYPQEAPQEAQPEGPADVRTLLPETQELRNQLENTLAPGAASALVSDYVNGKLDMAAVNRHIDSNAGINDTQTAAQVAHVVSHYESQAGVALTNLGMTPEEAPRLAEYATSGMGKELAMRVFNEHVTQGKVGGYKELLDAYRLWESRYGS